MQNDLVEFKGIDAEFVGLSIRAVAGEDGKPWFVAKDVCDALEIVNVTRAVDGLDEDEKGLHTMKTLGGKQELTVVSEPGLYSLILRSRKEEAKRFKRWITHEVLPCIRKFGAYMTPERVAEVLLTPDTIITIATALKEEQEKNREAMAKIVELTPKANFHDMILASPEGTISIRETAVLMAFESKKKNAGLIGQNELFDILRRKEVLMKAGSRHNQPYQRYLDSGYFMVREWFNPEHGEHGRQTMVTLKGVHWLVGKMDSWGYKSKKDFSLIDGEFGAMASVRQDREAKRRDDVALAIDVPPLQLVGGNAVIH